MLEPYDPDRITVILIHGLTSIPQMWVPTIAAIESDPKLRGRYQFWVFAYLTGDPILVTALKLRQSLAQVYQLYPKTKNMVLISHSKLKRILLLNLAADGAPHGSVMPTRRGSAAGPSSKRPDTLIAEHRRE